ncbi:nicotinamide-nucleotide amidase [Pseudonocardia thermophila]|jgi:competence/damage-inducible protein CinA C-terminal domain|uniref:Nicotinamide-nucleotide amidase n=1 Tax=Pseudonocardia thermophila TaxID=1848 RepID=A0A1M6XXG5_PSETH|nr:CinA family protein [Pseudonocardia thermophila]SHL10538.1 nicotinamide-nucleotide amidase [Pseudonocardia thermophila]
MTDPEPRAARLAAEVAEWAGGSGVTVAAAESLTGGQVCAALAAAEGASAWYRGGIVAYASAVKHELLGVEDGPVVSAPAAEQMATGTLRLLGADVAVAMTGAGGPDPQDGQPPGTVFLAVAGRGPLTVAHRRFDGPPGQVCERTVHLALELLVERLRG